MRGGRAIWQAYDDTHSLDIDCPHCGAQTGQWCTRADGRVRRIPCVERAASDDQTLTTAADFSEPIHQIERTDNQ